MNGLKATLLAGALTLASSGCLVVSIHPGYDESTIGWDPNLIGYWVDADDKATLQIDRGEWSTLRLASLKFRLVPRNVELELRLDHHDRG